MEEVSFEEEKLAQIKCTPEEAKERITRCKELIQLAEEARDKAKFQASLELYQKAQAIISQLLGVEHLETASIDFQIAGVYRELGKYKEAKRIYYKVIEVYKKAFGEGHPRIVECYNGLAVLYTDQGMYAKAEEWYEKALEIYKEVVGVKHWDTIYVSEKASELK